MNALALSLALLLQVAAPQARTGIVAGQVLTRDGVPAAAVRVFVILAPAADARPEDGTQYYEPPPPTASVLTNAQGHYRLANVPPGRYHVVAGLLGEATYFPSTMDVRRATVVTVGTGTSLDGIDVRLATPYGGRVRGTVMPPAPAGAREIAVLSGLRLQELLEVPVGPDGSFEFGHVPRGSYLVSLFPTPPGMPSRAFDVGNDDVTSLNLTRPLMRSVSGRVVVPNGPLPHVLLAFATPTSYAPAELKDDGAFIVRVQEARQVTEVGGLPVGYTVESVRLDGADMSKGFSVAGADVAGLVVTLRAPALPDVRGRVERALAARARAATVELTGPVKGALRGTVDRDGSFVIHAVVPGLYSLRVPKLADVAPMPVVVTSAGADVTLVAPAR